MGRRPIIVHALRSAWRPARPAWPRAGRPGISWPRRLLDGPADRRGRKSTWRPSWPPRAHRAWPWRARRTAPRGALWSGQVAPVCGSSQVTGSGEEGLAAGLGALALGQAGPTRLRLPPLATATYRIAWKWNEAGDSPCYFGAHHTRTAASHARMRGPGGAARAGGRPTPAMFLAFAPGRPDGWWRVTQRFHGSCRVARTASGRNIRGACASHKKWRRRGPLFVAGTRDERTSSAWRAGSPNAAVSAGCLWAIVIVIEG